MRRKLAAVLCALPLCAVWALCLLREPPRVVFSLLLAVILHESGHVMAMKAAGLRIKGLIFLPFGAMIDTGDRLCGYLAECAIYLSGPAASFLGAVISARRAFSGETGVAFCFCVISAGLGCFNLLPLPSLDGAGALRAVLLYATDDMAAAERAARVVTAVFCIAFWLISSAVFLAWGRGAYLVLFSVYFLLRLFCG